MSDSEKAFAEFKAIYEDCEATINGRIYAITKTTHKKRRKVFAFFTKNLKELSSGNYSCLDSDDFEPVEKTINDLVLFEGSLISRLPEHWEKYPEDYAVFVVAMLGAISYPFLVGLRGS